MFANKEVNNIPNSTGIVSPHVNAEVYRRDTTGTNTFSYVDYIYFHADGSALLGCSELTGRYWNSGVNILTTAAEQQLETTSKKQIYLMSGTADGCFIGTSQRVLLCEDSGSVSIWSRTSDAWKMWDQEVIVAEHDDAVLATDCLDSEKDYVTVGADGNIKVWDIREMICVRDYRAAHSRAIYGVAVRPNSIAFATGSTDQYVALWSENINRSVLELEKNDCGIRCLQWLDENQLMFGDEVGVLRSVDIRKHDIVSVLTTFPAPLHRISIQSETGRVAVCCDNEIVSVCKINCEGILEFLYRNHNENLSSYYRGLAWSPNEKNTLYTSAWDGRITSHCIA